MSRRWIVYLDLDGTLLNSELAITDRVRTAVRAAEPVANIVITSGRPAVACLGAAAELLKQPKLVIASNGGAVIECGSQRVLSAASFTPGAAAAVAAVARSAGVSLWVYHPLYWYAEERDMAVSQERRRSATSPILVPRLDSCLDMAVKLMLVGEPTRVQPLRAAIEGLGAMTAFTSYPEYLEIMPASANKATGARIAQEYLGTGPGVRTLAIGDGLGDLPLFAYVAESVAVANASEAVRRAATYVAPSNDQEGAAVALEGIVLGLEGSRAALSLREGRHNKGDRE